MISLSICIYFDNGLQHILIMKLPFPDIHFPLWARSIWAAFSFFFSRFKHLTMHLLLNVLARIPQMILFSLGHDCLHARAHTTRKMKPLIYNLSYVSQFTFSLITIFLFDKYRNISLFNGLKLLTFANWCFLSRSIFSWRTVWNI